MTNYNFNARQPLFSGEERAEALNHRYKYKKIQQRQKINRSHIASESNSWRFLNLTPLSALALFE